MNLRQFFLLLKFEVTSWLWLAPLFYTFVFLEIFHHRMQQASYMFHLDPGDAQQLAMTLWFAFWAMFLSTARGVAPVGRPALNQFGGLNLEFFFGQAIHRPTWFAVKTTMFTALGLVPVLMIYYFSCINPMVKVELPYNTAQDRIAAKQFYLTHFEGSTLEEPDTGKNEVYVILPHGRQSQALHSAALNILLLTMFEVLAFLLWPRMMGALLASMGTIFFSFFLTFLSRGFPSRYETEIAYVCGHPLPTFAALGVLFLLAQIYCGRRFVNTEMTS